MGWRWLKGFPLGGAAAGGASSITHYQLSGNLSKQSIEKFESCLVVHTSVYRYVQLQLGSANTHSRQ